MDKREFKLVATYNSAGSSIDEVFYNIFKLKLLSCENSGFDSQQAEEVQYEAQDK